MQRGRTYWVCWAVTLTLLCPGCRSKEQPTSQPAQKGTPALTLLAAESAEWSREQACANLADAKLGLSAAVRLVRLAKVSPLCLPAELTDAWVRRLRLVRLGEERWALGLADTRDTRRLRAPVVIAADGNVALLADGAEEELLVLHLAADPAVFPHLALLPDRVVLLREQVVDAITLAPEQRVRFELRRQQGYPYVGLILPQAGQAVEVARYTWDPDELMFAGPAIDKLPDPPGGKFEVDLDASKGLVPVGGEVPEPETQPARPRRPPPDEPLPA